MFFSSSDPQADADGYELAVKVISVLFAISGIVGGVAAGLHGSLNGLWLELSSDFLMLSTYRWFRNKKLGYWVWLYVPSFVGWWIFVGVLLPHK